MKTLNEKELRELDAWIAERVMGWSPEDVVLDLGGIHPEVIVRTIGFFHPTTDPAAAMQVLERCLNKGGGIQIFDITVSPVKMFKVSRVDYEAVAETLPLAICLFAKKLFSKPQ